MRKGCLRWVYPDLTDGELHGGGGVGTETLARRELFVRLSEVSHATWGLILVRGSLMSEAQLDDLNDPLA